MFSPLQSWFLFHDRGIYRGAGCAIYPHMNTTQNIRCSGMKTERKAGCYRDFIPLTKLHPALFMAVETFDIFIPYHILILLFSGDFYLCSYFCIFSHPYIMSSSIDERKRGHKDCDRVNHCLFYL